MPHSLAVATTSWKTFSSTSGDPILCFIMLDSCANELHGRNSDGKDEKDEVLSTLSILSFFYPNFFYIVYIYMHVKPRTHGGTHMSYTLNTGAQAGGTRHQPTKIIHCVEIDPKIQVFLPCASKI